VKGRGGEGGYRAGKDKGKEWGILFWNVAGLGNKDREFRKKWKGGRW
jgi:hypothetical protein